MVTLNQYSSGSKDKQNLNNSLGWRGLHKYAQWSSAVMDLIRDTRCCHRSISILSDDGMIFEAAFALIP